MESSEKFGLVLSGGGTRGIAHIGAWRVLASIGFRPNVIAGCSMGAIVGALIASGRSVDDIETFALSQRATALLQWPITKLGLAKLTKLEQRLNDFIGVRTFEELKIPLIINATNLTTGQPIVYDRGPIWPAIRATISIPGFFTPIRHRGDIIVDGGILHEHPFMLLPPEVQKFIMVNSSPREHLTKLKLSVVDVLRASLNVMQNAMAESRLAAIPPERYCLIEPEVAGRNLFESDKQYTQLIKLGVEAAEKKRPQLVRFLRAA